MDMKNQSYARLHKGISMRYHWGRKVRCGEKRCIYDPTFVNQGTASPRYVYMYIFYVKYLSLEKTWKSILYLKGIMKAKVKSLRCVWLFATPWTVVYQASPSMGFSRQEYWSGVPLPYYSINWSVHKLKEHKACSQCNTFCSLSSSWLLWVIHPYPSCSHKAFAMSLRLGSP